MVLPSCLPRSYHLQYKHSTLQTQVTAEHSEEREGPLNVFFAPRSASTARRDRETVLCYHWQVTELMKEFTYFSEDAMEPWGREALSGLIGRQRSKLYALE